MNFLNVFEQRVGSLFGATAQGTTAPFSFKKLAKQAAREMEAETFIVDGVDTAPGLYTILVSSDDDLVMRPLYPDLTTETAQFIEGQAQAKGYVFVDRPVVRFMADPSLKSGRFSVFAENVDATTLSRIREEEARFLGTDLSSDGLGGAAAEQASFDAAPVTPRAAAVARQSSSNPVPIIPTGQPMSANPSLSDSGAGLDVLPQDFADDFNAVPAVPNTPAANAYPAAGGAAAGAAAAGIAGGAAAGYAMANAAVPAAQNFQMPAYNVPSQQAPVAPNYQAAGYGMPNNAMQNAGMPGAPGYPAAAATPQTVRVPQAVSAPAAAPITCLLIDRSTGRTYIGKAPRTIIGRERAAGGIVLHDPNVSRAHAELSFDGRTWRIRDLNSTNGTLVNDVDMDECALRDGDLLTLGVTNLEFREN